MPRAWAMSASEALRGPYTNSCPSYRRRRRSSSPKPGSMYTVWFVALSLMFLVLGQPDLPGGAPLRQQLVQLDLVAEGVHAAPEAVVRDRHHLALLHQAPERLHPQLLAFLHVVEDLPAQSEVAAVDAQGGVGRVLQLAEVVLGVGVDDVEGLGHAHAEERGDLVALHEALDVGAEVEIGQTVRVVGQEHLVALDVLLHAAQALAAVRALAGVDEGDVPVVDVP